MARASAVGKFSPDGRWLAYTSDETGIWEVYVRPMPGDDGATRGARRKVSSGGGSDPLWRHDGRELFFLTFYDAVMSVRVDASEADGVSPGAPVELFRTTMAGQAWAASRQNYDMTADGERFLIVVPPEEAEPSVMTLVVNWDEEL